MYSTSANVSILVSTTPLLTAIIVSACYSNERMTRRQVFGSLVAFVGAALVVLNGQMVLNINPLGDALAIGAAVTWALYSLFMRRVMQRYSPDFITRKVFAYGLLTILPYIIYVEEFNYSISSWTSATVIGNILFLGLLASTICYLLWNWVMRELGAVKSTNYIYLQSLITMIAGALILDERITLMGLCGALVLIIGMFYAVKK
jgi:drug/metabolite transporter (DMT)-like permease